MMFSHRCGKSRSGTEYGLLTDLPDWSFSGMNLCGNMHNTVVCTLEPFISRFIIVMYTPKTHVQYCFTRFKLSSHLTTLIENGN